MAFVIRRSRVSAVLALSIESTTRCLELLGNPSKKRLASASQSRTSLKKESSSEELNQHRSNHRRSDLVRLALQSAMLTVGKRLRQRYCRRIHERE